jgi:hypothetical protein
MLTTFSNAQNFTAAGDADPAALDSGQKAKTAALTALGVLIPGEVVTTATAVSGVLSAKSDAADGTATWLHLDLARVLMLALGVIAIPILFRWGAGGWWKNGWRGVVLLVLTIGSFAAWLVLQPLSIYQGWFSVDAGVAAAVGLVAALIVGGLAAILGLSQANK